ncbi:putative glycosyl hydrolases family 28 protein 1 [Elsinoe fawcettii]|nr:putative glycosyl hydrolases family 28 protein 1 [Elsinoe fawcettii]
MIQPSFLPCISLLALLAAGHVHAQSTNAGPESSGPVKRAVCTVASGGVASFDDGPAIAKAVQDCGNGGTIVLPAGKQYMLRSPLDLTGCKSCDIQLEGTIKASDDVQYWNGKRFMIKVDGWTNGRFRSLTGTGLIDGNGQAAWDAFAKDTTIKRPTLVVVTGSTGSSIDNIHLKNAENVFFSVEGKSANINLSNLDLRATSKSSNLPKNTDGFDIGLSSYVALTNINVVNDDDCVAFKPGCNYVHVKNITCTGSHGLSVGSLGKAAGSTDTVTNVLVQGATMIDSTKAAGIKVYPGGSAHGTSVVRNVTWDDVTVQNSDYAFTIEPCYGEEEAYCKANGASSTIEGVYVKNFKGTTSKKYAPTTAEVFCPVKGTACDVHVSGWTVQASGATGK